jgi:metal transporter CNNM
MPVRKNGHLLLTSLVIVNMLVNEALVGYWHLLLLGTPTYLRSLPQPVVADEPLGGGVQAVIVSTVLIVM